jgi:hypothetical protein
MLPFSESKRYPSKQEQEGNSVLSLLLYPEDGVGTFARNADELLSGYTVLYPQR